MLTVFEIFSSSTYSHSENKEVGQKKLCEERFVLDRMGLAYMLETGNLVSFNAQSYGGGKPLRRNYNIFFFSLM